MTSTTEHRRRAARHGASAGGGVRATVVRRLVWAAVFAVALPALFTGAEALAANPVTTSSTTATTSTTSTTSTTTTTGVSAEPSATVTASAPRARTSAAVAPSAASIGVLSGSTNLRAHTCTAAVVASASGEVIVTAAHCVSGTGRGLVFAPGYRAGAAPHGTWVVTAAYVSPGWLNGQNPQDDVAFLTVRPASSNHSAATVQAVVGGYPLASAPRSGARVRVTGYVNGTQTPISCSATVYTTGRYPSFDCAGFAGGTSGGPWISAGATGAYAVSGVIGGLHQGGCSPDTSYSSAFSGTTAAVLARAAANRGADTLPNADSDGC